MPKVSVIIPVYNAEKYLDKCISSIADQTLQDIEIIAVNDGSTDNSLNVLDRLSEKYKGKLVILEEQNSGAGAARNLGIENAHGEYIKFVDADDYLELEILDRMYNLAKEYNVSLVRGNYQTILGTLKMSDKCSWSNITSSGVIIPRNNKDYMVTETPSVGNKLIGRELLGDLRFPEKTKWEDLAIMPVVVASSERLFHLDEPVYNYRVNMNTTVKDFIRKIPSVLDVIKCATIVEEKMAERGLAEEFQDQISSLYIIHTLFRVENAMNWVNFSKDKKDVVVSSLLGILDTMRPNWQQNRLLEQYQKNNPLFALDMKRLKRFVKQEYRNVDKNQAEANIGKVFK